MYQILYKLEKVGTDTNENIKPSSSKDATRHMQVSMCFCCFKDGRTSIENDEHIGCPSMRRNEEVTVKVCDMLTADQRLTISGVAKELEFHFGSYQAIVTTDSRIGPVN
jgi:hypothetical protein